MTTPYVPAPAATPMGGKQVTRLILAVLGAIAAPILGLVFSLVWVFTVGPINGWGVAFVVGGTVLGLLGPVILFSVLSAWSFAPSQEGDAYLARYLGVILGVEVVSIAAVIVSAFITQPQIWLPITIVTLTVAFTVVGFFLGRALRTPAPEPVDLVLDPWVPPKSGNWFWWIPAGIFVVVLALALLVFRPWGESYLPDRLREYFLGVAGACFCAAIACMIRYLVVLTGSKLSAGRNFAVRQRVGRAIFRSKPFNLTPTELEYARRNALVIALAFQWQLAYICFFYVGLFINQVPFLPNGIGPGLSIFLAVALVFLVVFMARYILLARRFLRLNGQPVAQPAPQPAPVAPVV